MTDHQKLALFFALVFFIGIPYLGQLAKKEAATAVSAAEQAAAASGKAKPKAPPVKLEPPLLNETNLTNSRWELSISGIQAEVTLLAGGKAAATTNSSFLRSVEGTWKVSGPDLTVTASAMGQTKTTTLKISGSQILVEGKPIKRLQ